MLALQIAEPGKAGLVSLPDPTPGPEDVLVEVEAITTCPQWDLHIMGGEPMFPGMDLRYPYSAGQPGHEALGRVVAVGEQVPSLAVGQRVVVWRDRDHAQQGCYAELIARNHADVLAVPDDLPAEKLTAMELAMCVRISIELLERMQALHGARFGISGMGPSGIVALQMARAAGAREIVAFDLAPERRELAVKLGADAAYDPRELPSELDRDDAEALDSAIDCVGNPASVQFLMDRTRDAVALFGVLRAPVEFGWRHWPGLALLGYRPHNRQAAEEALALVLSGDVDLSVLVSTTLPLAEYAKGVDLLRRQEAIKVCFRP